MSKYNSQKSMVDGLTFGSNAEARRYCELQMLANMGEISELRRQVPFELVPKCGKNRAVMYKADFVYRGSDGAEVVEDVKGMKTKEYIIKRKLMLFGWYQKME